MKIGFFDSGLGGLLILKAVAKALPDYDYEFYGDTANLPYGDKTEEQIYELTQVGIKHLFARDCQLVIVACNTASAETLRRLQDEFLPEGYNERRILGVIIPTVEELASLDISRVLLFATKRTVDSKKYEQELAKIKTKTVLVPYATPKIVPLIESGQLAEALSLMVSSIEVEDKIDGVILGCTHYSLLKDQLRERFPDMKFLAQDEIIPLRIVDYLARHPEIETKLTRTGIRNINLTDNTKRYDEIIPIIMGGVFMKE